MKFGNELTMELDQLDRVSGGTYHEYRELSDFMYDVKNCGKWKKHQTHLDREDDIVDYLREEMGIKANLHGGFLDFINPFTKGVPAEYTDMKTGKALSHQEVLSRVKARFK